MQPTTEAEEHLRVIRSLMERATIYRAISAPSALVGGMLAIVTASLAIAFPSGYLGVPFPRANFALVWLVVLIFATAANFYFLRRDATRRSERFVSPGMRLALASVMPSFLAAGVFTVIFGLLEQNVILVCLWLIFYGVGLLATTHFAPRSIRHLGWAFLLAGLVALLGSFLWEAPDMFGSWKAANVMMAITFGGFHLIYATCTWPHRAPVSATAMPSTDV